MVSLPVVRNGTSSGFTSPFSPSRATDPASRRLRLRRLEAFEDLLALLQIFVVGDQTLVTPGFQAA